MKLHSAAARGDLAGLREQLATGTPVDARDEDDYTPLGRALESPTAGVEVARLLISAGANVHARVADSHRQMLDLAAASGDLDKVRVLLEAGADIQSVSPSGYSVLVHAIYALHQTDKLLPVTDYLIEHGADVDSQTEYGESPLSVASRLGRFDAVQHLMEAGADPSRLRWNDLMHSVALGTIDDVKSKLESHSALSEVDRFGRTALLLSCLTGDTAKVELIHAAGANINQPSRGGRTPLMHCAEKDKTEVLQWLVDRGVDLDAKDESQSTALMIAAQVGADRSVHLLLEAGADPSPRNEFGVNAMTEAASPEIVRMLCEAGEDITDVSSETKRQLLGLSDRQCLNLRPDQYQSGKHPRFGKTNPEIMDIAFWKEMVRVGFSAWQGRAAFGDTEALDSGPIWCLDRFGISFTALPDGRYVQVGGEHEDFYDPDFCIYNDVIVHQANGQFQILGYPQEVFPPTDFHSSTFVDGQIYILGGLGYVGSRKYGFTPCYRLDCENWRIESVDTSGANPGWIYEHKARLENSNWIVISGGTICQPGDDHEQHVENQHDYRLNLTDMTWHRGNDPARWLPPGR